LSTESNNCLGASLNVISSNSPIQIIWYSGSTPVSEATRVNYSGSLVSGGKTSGAGASQLNAPSGVEIDANGNIYVVDAGNNRIQEFAPGATSGVTVAGGKGPGAASNQLNDPGGIYIDAIGDIYVADVGNNRVQEFSPGSVIGVTVAGGNGSGQGANQLSLPAGVFVDGSGNIYIADQNNNRIQEWAAGATSGITVAGGNGAGTGVNQLSAPTAVFVTAGGNIYVADQDNNRIQEWTPGAASGITVAGGNGAGGAANQLSGPDGVFVDGSGNVYIADYGNGRIQEWPPGAGFGITIAGSAAPGSSTLPLIHPDALDMDANGSVYLTDRGSNTLQKWSKEADLVNSSYTPSTAGTYTAMVSDEYGCNVTSNPVKINPTVPPSVSITASATSITPCNPATFTASSTNGGDKPSYQWQVNGANTGGDSAVYYGAGLANGATVSCVMTSDAGCPAPATAQSNSIVLSVAGPAAPAINITASATTICSGAGVNFTAEPTNAGAVPSFQWQLNGSIAGGDSPVYTNNNLADGDVVTCQLVNIPNCAPAVSNSIPITVNAPPTVAPGQVFSIPAGQSGELDPEVTGTIGSYLWSPATGLSNDTVRNPIVRPLANAFYTLQVVATNGCEDSGTIAVKIFTQLRIPNAFTPNGDGHNDIFYIGDGPTGSLIRDLSIFDRWGQRTFQAHNASPGDPASGWNGNYQGKPAPSGTYIYFLDIVFADGEHQILKGTVILIR
jgi:gliding motility-associated-like protein